MDHVAQGFSTLKLGDHWFNLCFCPSCVLILLVSFSRSSLSFFLKHSFTLLAYTNLSSNFLTCIISIVVFCIQSVPLTLCKFLYPGIDPGTYVSGTPYITKCYRYVLCYVVSTHTYTQCNEYYTHNIATPYITKRSLSVWWVEWIWSKVC